MTEPIVERLITPAVNSEEARIDRAIRPRTLAEYIGQKAARERFGIFLDAARRRKEPLDHVLLYGPPGLGKTTLAHILAEEMGVQLRQTSGPVLERPGDLAAILTNLEPRDILFVDEIHRLSPVVEEVLYPAMEDYQIDILIGEGPAARSVRLDLPPFTLVGATTRAGALTMPLHDRFGIVERLEFYSHEEMTAIILRSAGILLLKIEEAGAIEIAAPPAWATACFDGFVILPTCATKAWSRAPWRWKRCSCSTWTPAGSTCSIVNCCKP